MQGLAEEDGERRAISSKNGTEWPAVYFEREREGERRVGRAASAKGTGYVRHASTIPPCSIVVVIVVILWATRKSLSEHRESAGVVLILESGGHGRERDGRNSCRVLGTIGWLSAAASVWHGGNGGRKRGRAPFDRMGSSGSLRLRLRLTPQLQLQPAALGGALPSPHQVTGSCNCQSSFLQRERLPRRLRAIVLGQINTV